MKRSRGFTLIELLIVVAIIGIIAAIAIPNLLNAVQRGKQKRTMGDMRTVSTAVESYAVDMNQYAVQAIGSVAGIATLLETTYIRKVPVNDGWNTAIEYVSATGGQAYTAQSAGKNKTFEVADYSASTIAGQTANFNNDIVFSNGTFVIWPEGVQTSP